MPSRGCFYLEVFVIDHKTLKECFTQEFDLMGEIEAFHEKVETARYSKPLGEDGPFGNHFGQYLYELIQMRLDHYDEYVKLTNRIKRTYGGEYGNN